MAAPILTGALSRVPLGMLTDRYGGRIVFTLLMVGVSLPLYLLSFADTFAEFFLLSLAFGIGGAASRSGCGYVSVWFPKGSAGDGTRDLRHRKRRRRRDDGARPAALAMVNRPRSRSRRLAITASNVRRFIARIGGPVLSSSRVHAWLLDAGAQGLPERLKPLRDIVVWRLGFYYFLVFGSFVALAQWIVPYAVNVYELSIAQAGLLAAVFSLPSGVIQALGGWMSDYFGARTVMNWVSWSCAVVCLILAVPKMDILSPGPGITATNRERLNSVAQGPNRGRREDLAVIPPPARTPADSDDGTLFLPQTAAWQEPVVEAGKSVQPNDPLSASRDEYLLSGESLGLYAARVHLRRGDRDRQGAVIYRLIPINFPVRSVPSAEWWG